MLNNRVDFWGGGEGRLHKIPWNPSGFLTTNKSAKYCSRGPVFKYIPELSPQIWQRLWFGYYLNASRLLENKSVYHHESLVKLECLHKQKRILQQASVQSFLVVFTP